MITTKSELKLQMTQYICEYWVTGREKAQGIIEDMMEMALEKSVKELIAFFSDHYPLDVPELHATVWQGAVCMKSLAVWEAPEQELQRCLDEFENRFSGSEEPEPDMVCHAENLPFEEQAALFAGIELKSDRISLDFYKKVCSCYPELEEIPMLYMAQCLERENYKEAGRIVKKLEKKYPEDFELLKKRLTIYRHSGTREEVHNAASDMLDYQKKYNTYSGWITLNYAGNVQIEHGDMEGAFETFRHLINDWSRLSLKEEEGCMYVASAFVNIFQLPSRMLEADISLIAVQFCMFEQALERTGADLNAEPYTNIISTFVVEMSKKLGNPAFRPAFSLLLESLEERSVLRNSWYRDTFTSGHKAMESYRLNEDERIPQNIRFLCLSLYSDGQEGEIMPYQEKYELSEYIIADSSRKAFYKENYPLLYPKLQKMLQEVNKKGAPDQVSDAPKIKPVVRAEKKVGRNDPCPCGSGKKYKKCCGK